MAYRVLAKEAPKSLQSLRSQVLELSQKVKDRSRNVDDLLTWDSLAIQISQSTTDSEMIGTQK